MDDRESTKIAEDAHAAEDYTTVVDVRNRLLGSMVSLGWRMAISIMLPIIIGLKLDERFGSKPSYALTGFFLGLAGSAYLIYNEYKEINIETARLELESKKPLTKSKGRDKV